MKGTVLIITTPYDAHADRGVVEIARRGHAVLRVHPESIATEGRFSLRFDQARPSSLFIGNRHADIDDIVGCWYRKPQPIQVPLSMNIEEAVFAKKELSHALNGFLRCLECTWVSHPAKMLEASWKPLQLKVAQSIGMQVPATYIGNNPEEIRLFFEGSHGAVVYKTLQSPVIGDVAACFTTLLSAEHLTEIDKICVTAGIFQELVPKRVDIRVVAIGSQLFGFEIDSQAVPEAVVDWRRTDPRELRHATHPLPSLLQEQIQRYLKCFDLSYGALDFVHTPDDRYVFLECNPGGQFGWLEARTGVPLMSFLVDLLLTRCLAPNDDMPSSSLDYTRVDGHEADCLGPCHTRGSKR
jgi:glutathione synthase/RimK-type ligase-like ATP-grasp enzyme